MKTRRTLFQWQCMLLLALFSVTGCTQKHESEAFLPNPYPEVTPERRAALDLLRSQLTVSRRDRSPVAGRWEVMNILQTGVSVMSEDEAFPWMGVVVIYTSTESVLLEDACPQTGYQVREVPFEEYFRDFNVTKEDLKITTDPVEVTRLTCNGVVWDVPGKELIRVSDKRLLLNWDGLILVLVRYPDGIKA